MPCSSKRTERTTTGNGAARSANRGMKKIMTMLADAEVKHYNVFKQMKEHKPVRLPEATILKDVKNIFVAMREEGGLEGISASEIELYRKAQDIEKKTEDFYLEKASQVEEAGQKETFLQVAKEENKHYFILDRIIEFVSRPEQWLENAEFYHLEEY